MRAFRSQLLLELQVPVMKPKEIILIRRYQEQPDNLTITDIGFLNPTDFPILVAIGFNEIIRFAIHLTSNYYGLKSNLG